MATGSNRDVKLTLSIDTLGEDGVRQLQQAVQSLAKEGGDAAPEFQQLADEIGRLGQQNQALSTFRAISQETDDLRAKVGQAGQAFEEYLTKLNASKQATDGAREAQRGATAALLDGLEAQKRAAAAVEEYRNSVASSERSSEAYRNEVSRLKAVQVDAAVAVDGLRASLREANKDLTEAKSSQERLQTATERSEKTFASLSAQLRSQESAFDAAKTSADALGLSTENVAASEAQLLNAFNVTGTAARELAARLKEVEASNAFERQAAEAQKMMQASEYVRAYASLLDEADRKTEAAAQSARNLDKAFSNIGIRSIEAVNKEIDDVRSSMALLASSGTITGKALEQAFSAGDTKIKTLEREIRGLTGTLTTADKAAELFKNSLGQIAAGNLVADAVGYMVNKVKELGREFIDTVVQTEQFRRGLNAIYKDVNVTAQQFDFLRKTANANGIAIGAISESFVRFSAATKSANIPIAVTNDLFASVTRTAGSLGLSAEAVGGTLDALGQIASKGVVSLEELRQQLGDRMPGALSAAAKGLGLTDAELIKLVESGNLAARDFFPAFSKGLKELQGETEGLIPTWNRLKNSLTIATQNAGDAGGLDVMTAALKLLGAAVGIVIGAITGFIEVVSVAAKSIGILLAPAGTMADKFKAIGEEVDLAAKRQAAFSASIDATLNPVNQAAVASQTLASATAAVTAAAAAAGPQWDSMTRSQQAQAVAAQISSDKSRDLAAQLVATTAAIDGMLAAQTKETEAQSKIAKAVKEQGDTYIALAKIKGNESEILTTATIAAEAYASAQAKVAASHAEETRLLEMQRAKLVETRQAQGESAEAIAKMTVEIDKKIQTSKAETEQANASAAAAKQETEARKLSAETYGDQSKRAKEYGDRIKELTSVLDRYVALNKVGRASDDDVKAVREALAITTAKYVDSLNDSVKALQLEAQAKTIGLQATMSAKNSEVQLYEAKAQSARNSGDLRAATYYENEAKRIKIEADRISIQIKEIEIKLEREELGLKLELLKQTEPENKAKQTELELRLKLTDIKQKEIAASKELLNIKESDRIASMNSGGASDKEAASRLKNAGAIDTETSALEQSLATREKDIELKEKELELRDREAALSHQGSASMSSDIATRTGILNFLKQAGVDDEAVAKRLANEFADQNGNVVYSNNPGQIKYGGKYGTLSEALLKAAETYTFSDAKLNPKVATTDTGATTTSTTKTTATAAPTTVNISINGVSKSVNVASASDAAALTAILRQLETSANSAS